jgi:epsilon-lactone hydrolase
MKLLSTLACGALLSFPAVAMATDLAPLDVPAKALPAPTADISPGMQAFVGTPLNPSWNKLWKTGEEARAFSDGQAADTVKTIPALLERQHVKSEASTIDGVRVHILTPDDIPTENKEKVLIHLHGGCYVLFPGESGTPEGIIMAGDGHYKVISVDYRMPPEAYFPAAVDDAVTVYKSVLTDTPAKNIGRIWRVRGRRLDARTCSAGARARLAGAGRSWFWNANVGRDQDWRQLLYE